MVGQVELKEVIRQEHKQDCGCGCGGAFCGTARQDCGCGCGGDHCGAVRQELVLVGFPKGIAAKEGQLGQCGCDGSCGCRG